MAWIAGRQEKAGGFPGVGGDSINSAGLAIQAMSLQAARYRAQIGAAETFLAGEQNADGGGQSKRAGGTGCGSTRSRRLVISLPSSRAS